MQPEPKMSVFHRTEGDWDSVSTYRDLKKHWPENIDVMVGWAKGHANRAGQPLTKCERLDMEADFLTDHIRCEVSGVYGSRPNWPHWPTLFANLFI
jgi:hypothetical protein